MQRNMVAAAGEQYVEIMQDKKAAFCFPVRKAEFEGSGVPILIWIPTMKR